MCTCVHLGMANNVDLGGFHCLWKKNPFFIFWAPKMVFFKHLPRKHSKIGLPKFSILLDHIVCTNHRLVASQNISRYLSPKRQIVADSVGSGQNLNYRCLIVCSWFFQKIIFRFTAIYFMIDPQIVLKDYTPRLESSCPPFWPHFESSTSNSKKIKKM